MKRITLIRLALVLPLLGLSVWLAISIRSSIMDKDDEYKRIVDGDRLAIENLVKIREIMKVYFDVNGRYPDEWSKFEGFIKNGKVPITQKSETITKDRFGQDSIVISIDTLEMAPVFREMQPTLQCTMAEIKELKIVPMSGKEFELKAIKGSDSIAKVMVTDPDPVNPRRQPQGNKSAELPPLKFGSTTKATLRGVWEK